jgi:glycosyltransferase involved in cell wall biosynthesis
VQSSDNGAEAEVIRERGCSSWLSHNNQLAVEIMISIVIPVYNEEKNIPELYSRITTAAAQWGDDYEVVIVDDGSLDLSLQKLAMIHQRDPRWKVLSFSRNFGHQAAVSAGLFYCHGDVVAIMDADLQDPPEELPRFLEVARGYHVVYAIRTQRNEAAQAGVLQAFIACCAGSPRLKFLWMRATSV